ncbi:MAG TPA: sugar transferase [Gemmatimonadaceae bacterium]|nr:sugar transferase [Gemmatimonadaceae bacterium]
MTRQSEANVLDKQSRIRSHGTAGRARRAPAVDAADGEHLRTISVVKGVDGHAGEEDTLGRPTRSEQLNRAVNCVIAAVALVLLSPLMLVIAILVRLTSPGPILYMQTRVGLDRRLTRINALYDRRMQDLGGRIFTIYKFRTMHVNAEAASGAVWAAKVDPRVTTIGRFLRKTRLDELPQLWNVVKGDMNIVGPRPERPSIFARLRNDIAEYPLRQRAKPGITGWAQINHDYDQSLDDVRRKVQFDLEYIRNQSLAHDLKIMIKTVPVILLRKGGW